MHSYRALPPFYNFKQYLILKILLVGLTLYISLLRCGLKCCGSIDHMCSSTCGSWLSCRHHRCEAACHKENCRECTLCPTVENKQGYVFFHNFHSSKIKHGCLFYRINKIRIYTSCSNLAETNGYMCDLCSIGPFSTRQESS